MKTKILLITGIILLVFSIQVTAQTEQEKTVQRKLDSLIVMQNQLKAMQEEVYKATVYVDPLVNKKFGIEVNPMSFLAGNFTGGIQFFDVDRTAEISIPVSYFKQIVVFGPDNDEYDLSVDLQYRKFMGEHQNGFWFGGGIRFTRAKEMVGHQSYITTEYGNMINSYESKLEENTYFGLLTGIGYRYYTLSGFYWGFSISGGRYLNAKPESADYSIRSPYFYDMEFLKIGWTF